VGQAKDKLELGFRVATDLNSMEHTVLHTVAFCMVATVTRNAGLVALLYQWVSRITPGQLPAVTLSLGMGNLHLACGPYLDVAVHIVAEILTQAPNKLYKVISRIKPLIKILS
jgi:hypothetical protein